MGNLFDLSGKNILVTGASSGIGREIAVRAWMQGANLVITGRNEERLHETNTMINGSGTMLIADLTQEADLLHLVKEMPELDGVVFNAGTIEYTPLKFISYQKIDNVFDINYSSQVMLTGQLIKHKKIKKGASLVYISSISSKTGVPATAVYASSKAAINAYMKVVAAELAGQKIRANSICPGLIRTPLLERADTIASETFADAAKDYPLGIGEPVDVAGPVVFLLSDAAKWITGTEIIADGGLTIK